MYLSSLVFKIYLVEEDVEHPLLGLEGDVSQDGTQ